MDLPKTRTEVRHIPDWPGYAIDKDGNVWQCNKGRWIKMRPQRTAAGNHSVWLHLAGGVGNAARRIADIYKEVFDDMLPPLPGRSQIPGRGRPSGGKNRHSSRPDGQHRRRA